MCGVCVCVWMGGWEGDYVFVRVVVHCVHTRVRMCQTCMCEECMRGRPPRGSRARVGAGGGGRGAAAVRMIVCWERAGCAQ